MPSPCLLFRVLCLPATLAAAAVCISSVAGAQDTAARCIEASDRGQVQRDQGQLLEAKESFVRCAQPACPGPIVADCATWLGDVEARIPTLVLRARDELGQDLVRIRVYDGVRLLAEHIDGRALQVDQGEHVLRFERGGRVPLVVRLVAREGEKQRQVEVAWRVPRRGASPQAAMTPRQGGIPAGAWVLGGIGVIGLGGFGYFGWTAKSEVDDMWATCAPRCDEGRVDRARTRAVLANVSLGVSALAFGGAAYIVVSSAPPEETMPAPRRAGRVAVAAALASDGAAALLAGSF